MGNSLADEKANQAAPSGRMRYIIICMLFLFITVTASLFLAPQSSLAQSLATADGLSFDPHEQVGHDHSSMNHEDSGFTVDQALFYTVRVIYYIALMLAAGLMLWSIALPAGADDTQRQLAIRWCLFALRALLLAVLVFVFAHVRSLLLGYDGDSANEWLRLLTETATGRSWLALILLSLLGFAALRVNDSFKLVWALLLLAAECYNGHVLALPSNTTAIVLDFVHLVCSALWAGGLILLLLYWYADRKEAGRFAEKFTKAAWLSIMLLTVSGTLMTWIILPSWRYLLYTNWGIMLLVKAGFVALVAAAGVYLRRRAKQGKLPHGSLLKADAALMTAILIIAGAFTYVSPVPETEPLHYHKMGDKLHYTLAITPNGPGPNQVKFKVWLPEQLGAPVDVQLNIRSDEHPQRAAIAVQLQSDQAELDNSFPGFTATAFVAERVDLPSRGEWTAELIITDQTGAETKEVIVFRND